MREFKNHDLVDDIGKPGIRFEKRPARTPDGSVADGLYNAWIWLDNPGQYNSYTPPSFTSASRPTSCVFAFIVLLIFHLHHSSFSSFPSSTYFSFASFSSSSFFCMLFPV